jgi:hypothetical protein
LVRVLLSERFLERLYESAAARGSKASRSPSPTRLNASVVKSRNMPGKNIVHQAASKIVEASEISRPQDGVDAGTPMPRYDSDASNRTLVGMTRVV